MSALKESRQVSEIIVVDDGSTDNTKEVVLAAGNARLVRYEKNHGKSYALARGVKEARHSLILLLDADLKGITGNDIDLLVEPVLTGTADVTLSLRKNSLPLYRFIGFDFVSGERVFAKTLIEQHLEKIERLKGFGVEAYINRLIIENDLRVTVVHWDDVVNPRKAEKRGKLRGFLGELSMIRDVLRVISVPEALHQNYALFTKLDKTRDATKRIKSAMNWVPRAVLSLIALMGSRLP